MEASWLFLIAAPSARPLCRTKPKPNQGSCERPPFDEWERRRLACRSVRPAPDIFARQMPKRDGRTKLIRASTDFVFAARRVKVQPGRLRSPNNQNSFRRIRALDVHANRIKRRARGDDFFLVQFFTRGDLSGLQKGFDEFAFAANGHAGKFLEPFFIRHFRIGIQPLCEQNNLFAGNFTLTHSRQKMSQQSFRQFPATDFRHEVRRRKIPGRCLL